MARLVRTLMGSDERYSAPMSTHVPSISVNAAEIG
jgi:hypothetical protein